MAYCYRDLPKGCRSAAKTCTPGVFVIDTYPFLWAEVGGIQLQFSDLGEYQTEHIFPPSQNVHQVKTNSLKV